MEMVFSQLCLPGRVPARPDGSCGFAEEAKVSKQHKRLNPLDWHDLQARLTAAEDLMRALKTARAETSFATCPSFHQSAARIISAHQQSEAPVNQLCSTIGKALASKAHASVERAMLSPAGPIESRIFE